MKRIKVVVVLVMGAMLSGCIQYTLVPAGPQEQGQLTAVTDRPWNKSPFNMGPNTVVWTGDGLSLNRVVFINGIADGEPLFLYRGKETPLPKFSKSMLPHEIEDLMISSLTNLSEGQIKYESSNLRPVQLGGAPGVRFNLRYFDGNGMLHKGMVSAAIHEDKLFAVYYDAAAIHYFDKYAEDVEKLFHSIRLTSS